MLKSLKTYLTLESKETVYLFMYTNKPVFSGNLSQELHMCPAAFAEYL